MRHLPLQNLPRMRRHLLEMLMRHLPLDHLPRMQQRQLKMLKRLWLTYLQSKCRW